MTMDKNFDVSPVGDRQIRVTRDFRAPIERVFATMTESDLLRQWLTGPPGWSLVTCEDGLAVGANFRFQWKGPEGELMTMAGRYEEFEAPRRIRRSEDFSFGGGPAMMGHMATLELSPSSDGHRTHLVITLDYVDEQARDGALASGMGEGMQAGYEQLDRVLASA